MKVITLFKFLLVKLKNMKSSTREVFLRSVWTSLFLLGGAGVFYVLEQSSTESKHKELAQASLEKLRTKLSVNITKHEFDELVKSLREYHEEYYVRATSYDWTYYASLYFSASVITTIGKSSFLYYYLFVEINLFDKLAGILLKSNFESLKVRFKMKKNIVE